jgi:hypothetical protein
LHSQITTSARFAAASSQRLRTLPEGASLPKRQRRL